jgi:adenine C2-methylase RlmN of 23S rRNA A2503 and tRNA A37
LLLYEHECHKTEKLSKEGEKDKAQAQYYKKRYTKSKDTNEKMQNLITELENSVTQLHEKLRVAESEKQRE